MGKVDITIVLVTYNRAPMLRKALESLVHQETGGQFSYDILVIDDGSTDDTAAVVRERSDAVSEVSITYLYQANVGPYPARNLGVEMAQGNWVAFFDDDQWAEPRWLAELYRVAQEKKADCVGGAVSLDLPGSVLWELGTRTRRLLSEKFPSARDRDNSIKENIGLGNVLIRRLVFTRTGTFDPGFSRGGDTDLFWRVEKGGFRFAFAPNAAIHHVIPESRLQPAYLQRLCCMRGVAGARIQWRYQGPLGLIKTNFWRLGVALGRDLTMITIAACGRHRPLLLDSLLSFWYTVGYMRGSLFFLAPRVFPQKKFMAAFGSPVPAGARSREETEPPTSLRK